MARLVLAAGILFLPMVIAVGILVWAGAASLVEAWHCRHPSPDLLDRVRPFESSIADQAERWLKAQRPEHGAGGRGRGGAPC